MRDLLTKLVALVVVLFGLASFGLASFGLASTVPAAAQFGGALGDRGPTNDTFGGNYKDPQQKAADHLAKGLLAGAWPEKGQPGGAAACYEEAKAMPVVAVPLPPEESASNGEAP